MILLVIFLIHFAVASDKDDPECWFESNKWSGMGRDMDPRIPSKIEQDTGYKVRMDEPIMAMQMEEKKDEASYILVLATVEGKKERLVCFKGRVKDQQVLSMKISDKCLAYLQECKNYGLPKGFIKEWKDYIARMSKG